MLSGRIIEKFRYPAGYFVESGRIPDNIFLLRSCIYTPVNVYFDVVRITGEAKVTIK